MDVKSYRSPLGRVRGLGSAKFGADLWLHQRMLAFALIPLTLYVLATFFAQVVLGGSYEEARIWLHSPVTGIAMILLIGGAFYHGADGLQVIIEDYVHSDGWKLILITLVKCAAMLLALTGIVAVVKVMLGL